MPKTKISEFSSTPGNNTDIDGINIAEGCAPSGINDAIRELMSQLKDFQAGTAGDSFNGPVGTTTAAAGAFTTLSASGAVTLSGGTANGVPYLNGSKVLTTGSALTFDGTNFGVGTSSPSYKLEVNSVISSVNGSVRGLFYSDASKLIIDTTGSAPISFQLTGSEQMRLTSTGLGIGTSSPTHRLQVSGSGTTTSFVGTADTSGSAIGRFRATYAGGGGGTASAVDLRAGDGYTYLLTESNVPMLFGTNNTERMRIDSTGNVGIGTSSPSTLLHTSGTVTSNVATGNVAGYVMSVNGTATGFLGSSASGTTLDSRGATFLSFQTNSSERARIDSSGNLLVGTASQINGYSVPGSIQSLSSDAKQAIFRNSNATASRAYTLGMTNNSEFIVYANASTGVYLSWNATSWTSSSDERVKDIIEPITNAAEKVSSLRAVIGKYKTDEEGTRRSFLIAQDVQAVLPEAVNARDDEIGTLGLQYTDVIPLLVAAIKEQQAIIEQLKADVAALKGN